MVLGVRRVGAQALRIVAEAAVAPPDHAARLLARSDVRGIRRGAGHQQRLHDARQPCVAVAAKCLDQFGARLRVLALELRDQRRDRGGLGPRHPRAQRREVLQLHVEVAHGAEPLRAPAQLLPRVEQRRGDHLVEDAQRGAQAARGDAHVVELLDVLAESGAALAHEEVAGAPAQHRIRAIDRAVVLGDRRGAEVGRARAAVRDAQPGGELALGRGRQPALRLHRAEERRQRRETTPGDLLDLDAAQRRGRPGRIAHRRVVDRDLGEHHGARAHVPRVAARVHLEQRRRCRRPEHQSQPRADRPVAHHDRREVARLGVLGAGDRRGAVALGGRERLQRRLARVAAVAHAQAVAGVEHLPRATVEVSVVLLFRPAIIERERGVRRLGAQPAQHDVEVGRLELPLHLERSAVVHRRPRWRCGR